MEASQEPLLEIVGVSKNFGGVQALRDVDFTLRRGEIHGLVGENGAGKSTMMKIIAGVHSQYDGDMKVGGRSVRFRSPREALDAGIGMVHQELSLAPDLSVAENLFLGTQPVNRFGFVDWRKMSRVASAHLENLGISVDPYATIGSLPIGMQQLIEIARVLFSGARIVILDEPTSALSPPEIKRLFAMLKRLREEGRGIVFISHFLDDILEISDSVTVFRDGRKVASAETIECDKRWVVDNMIGKGHENLQGIYADEIDLAEKSVAPAVLSLEGLGLGRAYNDVSLAVRAGEILGVYGFMGCGQIELARTLFGKLRPDRGRIEIAGRTVHFHNTAEARRAGIAFVPESRRSMLFADEPIYKNITISILGRLSRLWIRPAKEREITQQRIDSLRIKAPNPDTRLGALSGGNQQKVALARWLTFPPKVLVLSEPTRGMDVGAKEDVIEIVRRLRDQGMAVIVMSTEPETILSLADRIVIMRKGGISQEFAGQTIGKNQLLEAA